MNIESRSMSGVGTFGRILYNLTMFAGIAGSNPAGAVRCVVSCLFPPNTPHPFPTPIRGICPAHPFLLDLITRTAVTLITNNNL
jgi:hypothetical protein